MNSDALLNALCAVCPVEGIAGPLVQPAPWTLYPASDGSQWRIDFDPSATEAQQQAAIEVLASYVAPSPPRRATLAALLDPLSVAQRAAILPDHLMRLEAEASEAADGAVFIGNAKVVRAAADMGLTPDAWFKLAEA